MGKKYRVDKKKVDRLETLEYSEMIKLAAVYKILEDEGVTPEIIISLYSSVSKRSTFFLSTLNFLPIPITSL